MMPKAKKHTPNLQEDNAAMTSTVLRIFDESTFFPALRDMRQKGELCDIKLTVKNQLLVAHRAVLTATIPYFRNIFASGEKIPEEGITINEVDLDALESLIKYAYGEELKITEENAQVLLLASEVLGLKDVKRKYEKFIVTNLNFKNVVEIRNFAERVSARSLIRNCDKYLLENIQVFFQSEEFLSLPFPVLRDIMKGMVFYRIHNSKAIKEENLFEGIISWIKASYANDEERERMLSELFRNIQLERISLDYLCERISSEQLIQASHICMELVEKTKAAHVPSTLASVYSQLFYRSSRRIMQQWHLKTKLCGSGVYAVCSSKRFGLYVRIYDSVKAKWVTLTQGISTKCCFKHVICLRDRIEIFGVKPYLAFEMNPMEWSERERSLPVTHKTLQHDNKIYIFDDEPCSSNGEFLCENDIGVFNKNTAFVDTDRTRMQILMPSVACLKEYVYISGGQLDQKCLNLFERYSTGTDTWTELPSMPTRRCGHISAVLKNRIYVCGGMNDMKENLDRGEVFTVDTNQWISVSPMNVARSRFSLVSWKGKLYAAGGAEDSGHTYSFEMFDPDINEWKYAAPIYVWDDVRTTKVKITSFSKDHY